MLRCVDVASMLQHFLSPVSDTRLWRVAAAYPEILNGFSVRRVGGSDEVIVIEVRCFG